jgi:hypothetical protein
MVLTKTTFSFCGDGFMDFIHRPRSKILKIKIATFRKLALLPSSGEWRGKEENIYSVGPISLSLN